MRRELISRPPRPIFISAWAHTGSLVGNQPLYYIADHNALTDDEERNTTTDLSDATTCTIGSSWSQALFFTYVEIAN